MTSWIKMGTGLASHGKVKALRRALKGDRLKVIGGLWAVWCVFDEHSAGGVLSGYTLDDMDEEIGWKGFSAAMRDIGWLIETDDGLEAPDYEEHNGPSAKRRALDASRKGKSRAKEDSEPEPTPPHVPQSVRDVSASDADNLRNREEKRREEREKNERHSAPDGAGATAPPEPPADPPPLVLAEAPPEPADVIFGLGLPLLTAAGVSDRNTRSMLGLMRKTHGDAAVIRALQRCATEKPLQPVAWLQAALKAPGGGAAPTPPKGDRIALGNIDTVRKFAERTMP